MMGARWVWLGLDACFLVVLLFMECGGQVDVHGQSLTTSRRMRKRRGSWVMSTPPHHGCEFVRWWSAVDVKDGGCRSGDDHQCSEKGEKKQKRAPFPLLVLLSCGGRNIHHDLRSGYCE